MKHLLIAATAALILGCVLPAAAAQPTDTYTTTLRELYGSPVPFAGTLRLNISPAGIVSGYYVSDDNPGPRVPVTGGENGSRIWFDIGNDVQYHITARLERSAIVGTALASNNTVYAFSAHPAQ